VSHSIDETYDVYDETTRTARKEHECDACDGKIRPGDKYVAIFIVFQGEIENLKRCARCQSIHAHLRVKGDGDMWPDERLSCGEEYESHWGKPPPEHITALAFWLPGDPLPMEKA
jgi:hypothetical protein